MKSLMLVILIGLATASSGHAQCNYFANRPKQLCQNANDFVTKKLRVMLPFAPADFDRSHKGDDTYKSPMPDGDSTNPALSQYSSLFQTAYNLAPSWARSKLCNLTYVFVTTDTTHSWEPMGVWESPGRGNEGMYIVIPTYMLDSALLQKSLAFEENALYGRLLFGGGTYPPANRSLPSFQDIDPSNTPQAALLAVLAHELGHIMLADTNADGHFHVVNKTAGRRLCSDPGTCFDDSFLSVWNKTTMHSKKQRRWIIFGDTNGNRYMDSGVDFGALKNQISIPANDAKVTSRIAYIYQMTGLVSLFASVSPEEDFVETYKYNVLAAATDPSSKKGLDLNIMIPSGTPIPVLSRVRAAITNPELNSRINCLPN
jgi:hypothetical protein